MTENNKPEWFEITDADEKPALRKVSKTLPVSAVLVTALILGIGAVVAQTQDQTPASAISASVEQTQSAQASSSPRVVSTVNSAVAKPASAAVAVVGGVAANKLANPSISTLPTGGGDDDDDDDDRHGRGHDDDDDDDEDEGDDD
jgi:predicted NodU family carbamoyl transferase